MKTILLFLFFTHQSYSQTIVGDDWKIDPETYEEVVVTSIDAEVSKLNSEEPLFGASPKKLDFKPTKSYSNLLRKLRNKRKLAYEKKPAEVKNLSWEERVLREQENWIVQKKKDEEAFIKDKKEILNKWKASKEKFIKDLPKIKKTLIPTDILKEAEEKPESPLPGASYLESELKKRVTILSQTFHLPIKHQGERSTCAAFAAVRGIEIRLAPEKRNYSEQFFFYLSRPNCQKKTCKVQGSWARLGLEALKNKFSLPREEKCPYQYKVQAKNITQIPLEKSCFKGSVKVNAFLKINNTSEIIDELKNNHPVITGFYVDDLFLENDGLVKLNSKKVDKRFAHTVLLLGALPLPERLYEKEGKYCLIAVNSWGSGWGIGGYSCLTQKWVEKHKIPNKPLAIQKVSSLNLPLGP